MDEIERVVISCIKADIPVAFGSDIRQHFGRILGASLGLWENDTLFSNMESTFGMNLRMSKEDRLNTKDEDKNHVMVFTGVHLENEGTAEERLVRLEVKNSLGSDFGVDGGFLMTDQVFRDQVAEVVVPRRLVQDKYVRAHDEKTPVLLKPWQFT